MPVLEWDKVGDRRYEAGVDRGVLYLPDKAVVWNGLTGVEESTARTSTSYYQDGIKYLEHVIPGDFAGTLKAYTYPDEFETVQGVAADGHGVYVHDQKPTPFGLSYRTLLGNDVDGLDRGYRIHLLYNLLATPANTAYSSLSESPSPIEFQWGLSATPSLLSGHRPTAHVSIKSTEVGASLLAYVESLLYGGELNEPYLPSLSEIFDLIDNPLVIVDNGDGSWTASGSDRLVSLLNPYTFQIAGVEATFPADGEYVMTIPEY